MGTAILLAVMKDKINKRTALMNMSDLSGRSLIFVAMLVISAAVGFECAIAEFFRGVNIDFRLRYRYISAIKGIDHNPSVIVYLADILCFFMVVIATTIMAVAVGFHLAVEKFSEVSRRDLQTRVDQLNVPMKSLIKA